MPANEVWDFQVTIPAGTPVAAPVTVLTTLPARRITAIHWRVPSGPLGLMGWRITSGKAQIIPRAQGSWMINDGQSGVWNLDNLPDSGAWEVTGYNTGVNPHSVYVSYHAEVIRRPEPFPVLILPGLFAEVADLSHAGPPLGGR